MRQLIQDRKGIVWAATQGGGVSRYDGAHWKTYTKKDGLPEDNIWSIATDSAGNLWCATYGAGVARFDGKTWTVYNRMDGLADNTTNGIAIDHEGRVWVATDAGVSLLMKEKPAPGK